MRTKVEFEGLEDAADAISAVSRKVGKTNSKKFVTLAAKAVEAQAAPFVPVDTSDLMNSSYTRVRATGSDGDGHEAEFGYDIPYAGYVHEGGPKNWQKAGASDLFLLKGVEAFIEEDLDNLVKVLGD